MNRPPADRTAALGNRSTPSDSPTVTAAVTVCPSRIPSGLAERLTSTWYELTLFCVVAVGEMLATVPVSDVLASALHATVAACPTLSLVASASAKYAEISSWPRSASWMKPDEDVADDDVEEDAAAAPVEPEPPPLPDAPEEEDDDAPTEPLTAVTVPLIGAFRTVPSRARCALSTVD